MSNEELQVVETQIDYIVQKDYLLNIQKPEELPSVFMGSWTVCRYVINGKKFIDSYCPFKLPIPKQLKPIYNINNISTTVVIQILSHIGINTKAIAMICLFL